MAYTTIKKPSDYFNTKLYTGNGSTQNITGVGFQPDWVWTKCRSTINSHRLIDAVRGVTKAIVSNSTGAEFTETNGLSAFGADGYTLNGNLASMNTNGDTYASWNWLANGAGAANTDGTISSTVSANTTSGFSIVSWAGNSTAGSTIGHNLGVAPKMIIVKDRDGADSWVVYHNSLAVTEYMVLNSTLAAQTDNEIIFYDTKPTSSVFTVGAHNTVNQSGHNYIAYCFAEKQGFSKFGSYTGNGNADGAFIYTGFKPSFIMYKKSSGTGRWTMEDNKRDPFNVATHGLEANGNSVENTGSNYWDVDLLSNGFKLRTTEQETNQSGQTFIYMAFAEQPLVGDNPATAR